MQPLQSLFSVLTLLLLQGAIAHGESSIPSPLQAVLTANNELFSSLVMPDDDEPVHPNTSSIEFLHTLSGLSKFTASIFSTAPLLNFLASSHENSTLTLKVISEIVSKIDSRLSERIRIGREWEPACEACGADEMNINTSWEFLKDFLERISTAKTIVEKSKLAARFTSSYAQANMDTSVANLYKYITEERLNMLCNSSKNNIFVVGRFSYYLSTLMVLGLQMRVYYYSLTDISGAAAKAEEAMTQLSEIYFRMQNVLVSCLESVMSGVKRSIESLIIWQPEMSDEEMKRDLDLMYDWYDWTVTTVKGNAKPPADFIMKLMVADSSWMYVQCTPRHPLPPCTEELCPSQSGHCRNVKALGVNICQCAKMFYGPKCERSVQDDIDQSLLSQGDNPIIVPDLTTIFYSIMDLKALLKKTN